MNLIVFTLKIAWYFVLGFRKNNPAKISVITHTYTD